MLQVYVRLSERLGLSDHLMVLNVMLSKIATNLKVYGSCDEVITLTLGLFQVQYLLPPYLNSTDLHCSHRVIFDSILATAFVQ